MLVARNLRRPSGPELVRKYRLDQLVWAWQHLVGVSDCEEILCHWHYVD